MNRNRYSDDDDAIDDNGILKDGRTVRVSMQMRDAAMRDLRGSRPGDACTIDGREGRLRSVKGDLVCVPLRSSDAKPRFVDGNGVPLDLTAGNRPGFRINANDTRQKVEDSYAQYESKLTSAYRLDGKQRDEDEEEGTSLFGSSNGAGSSDDHRTIDQRMRDHQANMSKLYDAYSREIETAYRKG